MKLKAYLEARIEDAEIIIAKFKADFEKNPHSALNWAGGVYTHVSRRQVARDMLHEMKDKNISFEQAKAYIIREAVNKARNLPRGSSIAMNLSGYCDVEAWAELADSTSYMDGL